MKGLHALNRGRGCTETLIKFISSFHIFRHTHISFLAEQGVPLEAIQDRVGHNRGSRVTNIYLHVTQKIKDTITPLIDS
ncbi:tyrosine-type recombinase/integrase [Streptococcus infantarius]|uniref:tyrosine-type recombinase/integrase n=1 Tax=Streptococcus infantarius TaxID=102684 RepID=UPI002FDC5502